MIFNTTKFNIEMITRNKSYISKFFSKKKNGFYEFYFLKNYFKILNIKYGKINNKRFFYHFYKKKMHSYLIRKKSNNYYIKLNFIFFLQRNYLYNIRNSISKYHAFLKNKKKKSVAIRSFYVEKILSYILRNKIQLNYFLNLQKSRRKSYFSSLFKIYNLKNTLNYLKKKKSKNSKFFYSKIVVKNKTENYRLLRKMIVLKCRKYFIKRKIKNFIFIENYIKMFLFNFVFYRYLVLIFEKYKFKNLHLKQENLMKIYILNRFKKWSFHYYKTKKIIKTSKDFYLKKKELVKLYNKKKISIKKIKNTIKVVKINSYSKLKSSKKIEKILKKLIILKYKSLIFRTMKAYILKKKKHYLLNMNIASKKYQKNQKCNLKKIYLKNNRIKSEEKEKNKFFSINGVYVFFKLYKNLKKHIFILKKVKKKVSNIPNLKKKYIYNKIKSVYFNVQTLKKKLNILLKYKRYISYLKFKYYRKYFKILNFKIKFTVNIWNTKNTQLFKKIYEKFILFFSKYVKNHNKIKLPVLKSKYGKNFKIHVFKENYKLQKKSNKNVSNYRKLELLKLYFVKTKNKTQLKNYVLLLNKKVKKKKTEDLRIKNKKEILHKNKNYLLHILYKRFVKIKSKKDFTILKLKKKKYLMYLKLNNKLNNNRIFISNYHFEKRNEKKIFQYFFNYSFIKKITKIVDYIYTKKHFYKSVNRKVLYNKLKKTLISLVKMKLVHKNLNLIFLNIKYKSLFLSYYKKLYLKMFFKIRNFKQYKIINNIKKNKIYIKKKYNEKLFNHIYMIKNQVSLRKNIILLKFKLKKNYKLHNFNHLNRKIIKHKNKNFKLKLKKLKIFYNYQTIDIKDDNSYYNIVKKRFNKKLSKKSFANINQSSPFDLFRSLFFKKGSFFDSLFFSDNLTFENNLRKKYTFEFLKSFDNRFDKEIPVDEFFFIDNSIQNKKIRGFFMSQPFTLPLLNILLNEKEYNIRKTIKIGKSISKIRNLNNKIKNGNENLTSDILSKKKEWDFILDQKKYESSNRKLLKSLLFSTIDKYSDYEQNHQSILKQKEFISYITLLFYDYEHKTNKKFDIFSLIGIMSHKRGLQNNVLDNYENRFKIKNSFQDEYSSFLEEDQGIRLDDKSIDNEELFTSFSNKDEPLDFYNDLDVFKNIGKSAAFLKKNDNGSKTSYKITNFFKNRKYKKENELEFESKIRQYYSTKIIKGSILTDFDSFLVQEHLRKNYFTFKIRNIMLLFVFKIIFYIYYNVVNIIIKYFVIYFKIKNVSNITERNKIFYKEKILWMQLLNIIYSLLQESFMHNIDYNNLKQNNYKYQKISLQLLLKAKNFNLQIEKVRALEIALINNFVFVTLQRDFDKKFFFEELLAMFNIEETDWFLMKDSLFYKKSSKDFKMLTSKYPYIERSIDVMLDKNRHLISLHDKKKKINNKKSNKINDEDINNNFIKNPKIFNKIQKETIQNLYDIFSHSIYKKMKTFKFTKSQMIKRRSGYRLNIEKRRKKRSSFIITNKSNEKEKRTFFFSNKKLEILKKPKVKLLLDILFLVISKKKYNLYKKKKSVKDLLKFLKTIKKYKKKKNINFFIRKKNLIKVIKKKKEDEKSLYDKILSGNKQKSIKTIKNVGNVFVSDLHAIRLKERSYKTVFRKKTELNFKNLYFLNFNNKHTINRYIINNISNYNNSYDKILKTLFHFKRKYRKIKAVKQMQRKHLLKMTLRYYLQKYKVNVRNIFKVNRSRNIKLYFKYVSAKLYRRRLFYYLLKKKKTEVEKRSYRQKVKNNWSTRFLFLDKNVIKNIYLKKLRKTHVLFNKHYKRNKFKNVNVDNNIQKMFIIKLIKMSRSKYQSKIHDRFFTSEEDLNRYLTNFNEDNINLTNIYNINTRSKYMLSFNTELLNLNFNKSKNLFEDEDDLVDEKLYKYFNLKKGFYLFSTNYNIKRIKRMIFRNFYLKKIMYKNKFFDYRQISREKYILKKILKIKYRTHFILKRQKKSIISSLRKKTDLKNYFIKKYFKSTFSLLLTYFSKLIFKRFLMKINLLKIYSKIENSKFLASKFNKSNKIFVCKISALKNSYKISLKKKLEKIVCFFLYRKKFSQFFSNKISNKLFTKIRKLHINQKKVLNSKTLNFFLNKNRKNLKKLFAKMPSKLLNKHQYTQSKYFNMEVSYYNKIKSIIKRNILIKNQHNYSWSSLTQDSKAVNYLIKSRSLTYNEVYRKMFMSFNKNDYFTSKNFFEFKLPFHKTQEKYIVKKILKKCDDLYYKIWEKFELIRNNSTKSEKNNEKYINTENKEDSVKNELLFLQWFINLNNVIKTLSKYLVSSLVLLLFFFSFLILKLNILHCLIFVLIFFNISYPVYFLIFHFIFRIIKLGIKVYYLRYLKVDKMNYKLRGFGFDKNKIKRLSVSFFVVSMSFYYCKKNYTRIVTIIFFQFLLIWNFINILLFFKIYFLSFFILFLNLYFFNLKSSSSLYVKIIEFLTKILIFEIPWLMFYWIFTLTYILDKYFFAHKDNKKNTYYSTKIERFIEEKIASFLITKTMVDLLNYSNKKTEVDFIFLEDFFKLNNMKLEKNLYIKYKKYLQK